MTDRFRLVPAAFLLLRRRHQGRREVLLQRRSGTGFLDGYWACGAAGHVEAGESVFAAVIREAREELGVVVTEEDLVPLTVIHRRWNNDEEPVNQRVDFYFACDHWDGEPGTEEPHKSDALGWFDLEELPEPVVPHEKVVLDGMRSGELPHVMALGF